MELRIVIPVLGAVIIIITNKFAWEILGIILLGIMQFIPKGEKKAVKMKGGKRWLR